MLTILHGSATTTHAIRAAIQRSKATAKELAERHGINAKTVAKWRKRTFVHDAPMGPKEPSSTVLSIEEEAIAVAFRKHTLLPLDDCLYALQATIPHLTRSSLHRCYERHGISRLPEVEGDKPSEEPFAALAVQVILDSNEDTSTVYANHAEISHNMNEFCVSFARVPTRISQDTISHIREHGKISVPTLIQVVLPPTIVPGLIKALSSQKDLYESTFAKIYEAGSEK
jgi:transposase-like protein